MTEDTTPPPLPFVPPVAPPPEKRGLSKGVLWGCIILPIAGLVLVVMIVILGAVLGAIAFPMTSSVQKSAKRAAAGADVSSIVTALRGYYLEYGRYPVLTQGADVLEVPLDDPLMKCLMGEDDPTGFSNPRKIKFIDPKLVDADRGGYWEGVGFYDPFGNMYHYSLDGSYDGVLANPEEPSSPATLEREVLVWSYGPDAFTGGGKITATSKAVMSWK